MRGHPDKEFEIYQCWLAAHSISWQPINKIGLYKPTIVRIVSSFQVFLNKEAQHLTTRRNESNVLEK